MKRALRIGWQLTSLVMFALIIWWAGPQTWASIIQADRQTLLIALLLYGVAGIASASRLQLMTSSIQRQQTVAWHRFFQANWIARALGLVLPRTFSGIGGKSVALRSFDVPLKRSVWIVMVDNLFDVILLMILCFPAFLYLSQSISNKAFFACSLLTFLLVILATGIFTSDHWSHNLTNGIKKSPWLAKKLNIAEEQELLLLPQQNDSVTAIGWTILLNLVLVSGFYCMAQAVGVSTNWLLFLAAYPFVQLSLIAAVTPGGLGIFDLGWLGLLTLGGISESDALTFVVAQRAFVTVFVLFWTGFSILLHFTYQLSSPFSKKHTAHVDE